MEYKHKLQQCFITYSISGYLTYYFSIDVNKAYIFNYQTTRKLVILAF